MLLTFFKWVEALPPSEAIRGSVWMYAFVQSFHLVALAVLAGAVLVVDLRLIGRGTSQVPLAQVARDAQPWLIGAFLAMIATGIPQVMSNAMREYYSPFFWFKMSALLTALIFTFTIKRKVTLTDEARVSPILAKAVGIISICLWTSVAIPGRLIGLLS